MTKCQDRVFTSFLCALLLSSVLGSYTHLNWTISEKKTNRGGWGYGISSGIEEIASWFFFLGGGGGGGGGVGIIENKMEFPGVKRKKTCGISRGLGFRA